MGGVIRGVRAIGCSGWVGPWCGRERCAAYAARARWILSGAPGWGQAHDDG